MTGGVFATIVNFFNPDRLVLGGVLADSSVFVAGVHSPLFSDCLPIATEQLSVDIMSDKCTGGLHGAERTFFDQAFSVDGVGADGTRAGEICCFGQGWTAAAQRAALELLIRAEVCLTYCVVSKRRK